MQANDWSWIELFVLDTNKWKKISAGSFKDVIDKMCLEIIYLIYTYKNYLALNSLHWLICHETKPRQILYIYIYIYIYI